MRISLLVYLQSIQSRSCSIRVFIIINPIKMTLQMDEE